MHLRQDLYYVWPRCTPHRPPRGVSMVASLRCYAPPNHRLFIHAQPRSSSSTHSLILGCKCCYLVLGIFCQPHKTAHHSDNLQVHYKVSLFAMESIPPPPTQWHSPNIEGYAVWEMDNMSCQLQANTISHPHHNRRKGNGS